MTQLLFSDCVQSVSQYVMLNGRRIEIHRYTDKDYSYIHFDTLNDLTQNTDANTQRQDVSVEVMDWIEANSSLEGEYIRYRNLNELTDDNQKVYEWLESGDSEVKELLFFELMIKSCLLKQQVDE